jgi:hypothetical protein
MKKHDITPGYQPDPLLRFQIEELSRPIRRSGHLPPAKDTSGRIAASLAVALLILATTAVLVHCSR